MSNETKFEREDLSTYKQPSEVSFGNWIESRVARYETRTLDWDALKFLDNLFIQN